MVKKDSAGLACATLNFFIMTSGFVIRPLLVYISLSSQLTSFGKLTEHAYQSMFMLMVWSLIIAALSIAFVDEEK